MLKGTTGGTQEKISDLAKCALHRLWTFEKRAILAFFSIRYNRDLGFFQFQVMFGDEIWGYYIFSQKYEKCVLRGGRVGPPAPKVTVSKFLHEYGPRQIYI